MDGYITIGTKLDTKQFDAQIAELEREIKEIESVISSSNVGTFRLEAEDISKLNARLEVAKNKLLKLRQEKQKLEQSKGLKDVNTQINNFGKGLQNAVKSTSRLILGIFGIRSAYMMLRRASSELAGYDEQYAANLEYIRFVLTQAIAPVLRAIVDLAMKLLNIINMIAQAWFGVNLFEKGSVDNFAKMKKGVGGVTGAVKELKKQLTGFDEINILQDNGDTTTGGGGGGITLPDFDISGMQGEIPEWLKWIMDNKDTVLQILGGIVGAITAIKLGLGGIKALGIGVLIAGVIRAIQGLLKYLEDPSWKNFGEIIEGIGLAILGVGTMIGGLPAIIAGIIILILGVIIEHWEKIRNFLFGIRDWIFEKAEEIKKNIPGFLGDIVGFFATWLDYIIGFFDILFVTIRRIFDGIIEFVTGVFEGDWEKAWHGIQEIFAGIFEGMGAIANHVFGGILSVIKTVINILIGNAEGLINRVTSGINGLISNINGIPGISIPYIPDIHLPRLKAGGIINMPNTGALLGGMAIGGEAGREGVVPLTDQQAMAELGREIGKNVMVNLTNITSMNGRVISRELKQVQADQEFAYNM